MRILHLVAPAPVGGLESVVQLLAVGQQARGHHVVVGVAAESPLHPFGEEMRSRGVEVAPIVVRGREYFREGRATTALIRRQRPEIVHTHGYRPDILHLRRAQRLGAAAVTTLHGFTGGDWKNCMNERLQVRAATRADAAVAVSRGIEARLLASGASRDRVHRIQNAFAPAEVVDRRSARAALGIADDALRLGWIGRLSPEKGPDVMVEALTRVTTPDVHLSFIGDGPNRDELAGRSREIGVGERVTFHGLVPNAARLVRAFDAVVLSSRTEGTPMVLLEAMAAGVPVIAAAVGGIPDVIGDREGLLVPSEQPALLARTIDALLADPSGAQHRAAAAQQRLAGEFAVDPWLDRYEQLYTSLFQRGTP